MAGFASITNIDKIQQPLSNYLWSFLAGHNRKSNDVTNWTHQILSIPNTSSFGIYIGDSGDYTVFRKHKIEDTKIAYTNITVNCQVSQLIVFVVARSSQIADGFNFRIAINFIELGGNLQTDFEFGFTLVATGIITNWQTLNTFDLTSEGIYFFDVRLKNQTVTIGKQSIQLSLNIIFNSTDTPITGGEEGDNPMAGTNSGE